MAATYQEFQTALNNSGLANQFSESDLALAQQHPEFGMSILNLKNSYANAGTQEEKNALHDQAERLRSSYGAYTGGTDGSGYVSDGLAASQALNAQNALANYGSFSYDKETPTYTNQYAQYQQQLLDNILNREQFSYDKDTDPQWSAYKKEYLREGDRATANALGQASAASGGRPSSYAQTAATQAGDYYAGQLADIIPTLYQQAYDKYLQEYSMKMQDLSAANSQEQLDYSKYLNDLSQYNTDRNFAYDTWSGNYNLLSSQYNTLQGQRETEYNYYLDALNKAAEQQQAQQQANQSLYQSMVDAMLQTGTTPSADMLTQSGYSQEYADAVAPYYAAAQQQTQQQETQALYQGMVDAMLQTGTMPSMDLLNGSGYNQEYANALATYYQNKLAEERKKTTSSGGGGSSSGSITGSGGQDYDGLYAAAKASGNPQSFIANNYKKYGFTSSSGLYSDYKNWLEAAEDESDFSMNDLNKTSVLNLGIGPIGFDAVEQLAEQGKIVVYTDKNGKLAVKWADGYNANNYKGSTNTGMPTAADMLKLVGIGN